MKEQVPDPRAILETLLQHEVEFIVVGGVCAALHGAPVTTLDLDIVHSRDPDNLAALVCALDSLGAYYREQPERRLKPQRSFLTARGHHLLITSAGPLDVLGTIGHDQDYHDLLECTTEFEIGEGLNVKVLNLDTLIEMKECLGRDKDRSVLPVLRRTLEEKTRLANDQQPGEKS